jgi:hypothetical protein
VLTPLDHNKSLITTPSHSHTAIISLDKHPQLGHITRHQSHLTLITGQQVANTQRQHQHRHERHTPINISTPRHHTTPSPHCLFYHSTHTGITTSARGHSHKHHHAITHTQTITTAHISASTPRHHNHQPPQQTHQTHHIIHGQAATTPSTQITHRSRTNHTITKQHLSQGSAAKGTTSRQDSPPHKHTSSHRRHQDTQSTKGERRGVDQKGKTQITLTSTQQRAAKPGQKTIKHAV